MSSRVSWFQSWWKWRASDQQTLWISSIRRDSAACFLVVGEYNSRVESTSHFLWYFYSLKMISRMSTCFRDERRRTLLTSTQGIPGWGVKSRNNVVTSLYNISRDIPLINVGLIPSVQIQLTILLSRAVIWDLGSLGSVWHFAWRTNKWLSKED